MSQNYEASFPCISVVIPARNEESNIGNVVRAVVNQCPIGSDLEVIVVDDGSTDGTAGAAGAAGAKVIRTGRNGSSGNPGAARNQGAASSIGDPLIFLDADCIADKGWLKAILSAHGRGEIVVGGSLEMPEGLSFTARCDYYCGWYLVHPMRRAGIVPHHPPPNLSVRREAFFKTTGFSERPPLGQANEERNWLREIQRAGHSIFFEPRAMVYHRNRPGVGNLLRRNYRWGYTAIESKSQTGAARMAWIYRYPLILILAGPLLGFAHTMYILACWVRAGRLEPVLMLPWVFVSRYAYVLGMTVGGVRWLRSRRGASEISRSAPRW